MSSNLAQRWEPTAAVEWRNIGPVVTRPADPFVARMSDEAVSDENRIILASRALRHDPGCIEAHLVLATWSPDAGTKLAHLQAAVKSGDALWKDEVAEHGRYADFWEFIGARPWLLAVKALGEAHAGLGNDQAAKWCFERLVRLNPADDLQAQEWLDLMNAAPRMGR